MTEGPLPITQLTPMLQQYFTFKEKYREEILFFRMGDFYEMFFEDAVRAAPILEIALTSRSKHQGQDIPMCGVPYHAAETYLNKLIAAGIKVAVCDQVEDPRQAKGIVAREVTRVVTPGMVVSPELQDPKTPRYVAAILGRPEKDGRTYYGLAVLDVSTGEFLATQVFSEEALRAELGRLGPSEILVGEEDESGLAELLEGLGFYLTLVQTDRFDEARARKALTQRFGAFALDGFGLGDKPLGVAAAGAVLLYAQETQGRDLVHVDRVQGYELSDFMVLDDVTKRNLELFESMRDRSRAGSLWGLLDRTITAMGGRKLKAWLGAPLLVRALVAERHDAVDDLLMDGLAREDLRSLLSGVHDLERLIGRISLGRSGPRDLAALKDSLSRLPGLRAALMARPPGLLRDLGERLDLVEDAADLIGRALVDDPPLTLKDGGAFREGYHPELDELIQVMSLGKGWIAALEKTERERTGIGSLKIGYNRVFGYYIEVTRSNLAQVPDHYVRRQTLAGAERFITPELKEQEDKVLGAGERRLVLEQELFEDLRVRVAGFGPRLRRSADLVAEADALAALAEAGVRGNWVRPELLDEDIIDIEGGRHPVVERNLGSEPFVANDVLLDNESQQVLIITGPNMAGKSTILRQTALIVILAQMGSFVPAQRCRLGLVSRVFTRVGASDDLARGRSTFMVEMNETAQILNQADSRSLVILDEIGRGTSTFDGLSIAWAVAEYLHDLDGVGVRTLFATHYHELVGLAQNKPRVRNFNVAVREWQDTVIFLRKLVPGGTSRSYGIAVARLAGLPRDVLERAREVLEGLENGGPPVAAPVRPTRSRAARSAPSPQLSLFGSIPEPPAPSPVLDRLKEINVDAMTPLSALVALAELKGMTS
jgi:DNA mismatch repair protein MutS